MPTQFRSPWHAQASPQAQPRRNGHVRAAGTCRGFGKGSVGRPGGEREKKGSVQVFEQSLGHKEIGFNPGILSKLNML